MILLRQAAFVFILSDCPHVLLLVAVRLRQKKIASLEEEVECINVILHTVAEDKKVWDTHMQVQDEEIWKWKSTLGKCEKKKKNDCPVFKAVKANYWQKFNSLWVSLKTIFSTCQLHFNARKHIAEAFTCRPVLQIMLTNTLLFKVKIAVFKKGSWNSILHKQPWPPFPEAACQWLLQTNSPPVQESSLLNAYHLSKVFTLFLPFTIKIRQVRSSGDSEIVTLSSLPDSITLITLKVDFLPEKTLSFSFPIWKDYLLFKSQFWSLNNDFYSKSLKKKKTKQKLPLEKQLPKIQGKKGLHIFLHWQPMKKYINTFLRG